MANLQEFHFSTGVKPYSHVPAVPVGKHEFVDGNGVKIIRFNLMYIFLAYHVQRKLPQKLKVTHTTCCYMSISKFPI